MFCSKCGTELADDAKFCTNCGTTVSQPSESVLKPESATAPKDESSKNEKKEQPKTILDHIKSFVALIFVILAAIALVRNCSSCAERSGLSSASSVEKVRKNVVDVALDKMDSAITRIEKLDTKKNSATTFEDAYGELMAEYSKAMKDMQEAAEILEGCDDSNVTPEQWKRILKLRMRMQN